MSYISLITLADKNFHYECPWSVAGTQVRDGRARPLPTPDIKKAVTQCFTSNQRARRRRNLHFPIPDYSDIPPKVDCWRIGGEDSKVSGAVACGVVQM
jgi:hypothetical protein